MEIESLNAVHSSLIKENLKLWKVLERGVCSRKGQGMYKNILYPIHHNVSLSISKFGFLRVL